MALPITANAEFGRKVYVMPRGIALLSNERKSARATSPWLRRLIVVFGAPAANARRKLKYERRCTKNADSCRGVPNLYLNALVETVFRRAIVDHVVNERRAFF